MESVDARSVAAVIRETIAECLTDSKIQADRIANAILEDIDGILAGQATGIIKSGQPRLAKQLIRLVRRAAEMNEPLPEEIVAAIGECAEKGLSARNQSLIPHDKRSTRRET